MLNRIPRSIPPLSMMLASIGNPTPAELAAALRVSADQVRAWQAADEAPHLAGLALFWLTEWGMSAVDAEAVNAARLHAAMARALADDVQQLRRELARVVALGDFGCANAPTLQESPVLAVRSRMRA